MIRAAGALLSLALTSATPPPEPTQCKPAAPVPVSAKLAPNSTYVSSDEPPARFLVMPKGYIKTAFGREAIDRHCGVPPCGMRFLGCVRGSLMVLPDPRDPDFAKITRHELGHWAGWPATHGE